MPLDLEPNEEPTKRDRTTKITDEGKVTETTENQGTPEYSNESVVFRSSPWPHTETKEDPQK